MRLRELENSALSAMDRYCFCLNFLSRARSWEVVKGVLGFLLVLCFLRVQAGGLILLGGDGENLGLCIQGLLSLSGLSDFTSASSGSFTIAPTVKWLLRDRGELGVSAADREPILGLWDDPASGDTVGLEMSLSFEGFLSAINASTLKGRTAAVTRGLWSLSSSTAIFRLLCMLVLL